MTIDTFQRLSSHVPGQGRRETVRDGQGAGDPSHVATMLSFLVTDAHVSPASADVVQAAEGSYNRITVDGDMSTKYEFFC
jgi:N-acetylglutamate synthase/N-acetylornithine aminotransferase